MITKRISGPAPIATPADIPGDHASNDAKISAIIAAVQATIDGPGGWLGRALGKQVLETWVDRFRCDEWIELYGPIVGDLQSIKYLDPDLNEHTVDTAMYRLVGFDVEFGRSFSAPQTAYARDAVRIRYEAGYEAEDVPPEARQAVVLMALHMKAVGSENLFLRSEEVDGVGTFQYTVSDQAGEVIRKASESLLSGLRRY